jgi:hypothetical protein
MKLRKDNNKIGGVHCCCHNIVSAILHPSHFRKKTTGATFFHSRRGKLPYILQNIVNTKLLSGRK